ncbi:MAG: hypothetical protein IJ165_08870 [Proteobacteria bacterium]|nr:hypothetical protein [Pseudomonadota bacterium]
MGLGIRIEVVMAQNCVICGSQIPDEVFDRNAGICDACWSAQYEQANPQCPQRGLEGEYEKSRIDLLNIYERITSRHHADVVFCPQEFENKSLDAFEFPAFLSAQVVESRGWDRDLIIHTVHTIDPDMKKFYIFALCAFGFICFTILVTIFTSFDLFWMIFDNYVTGIMFCLLFSFVISLFAYAIDDLKKIVFKNWFYIGKDYIGCYRGIKYNQLLSRKFALDEIDVFCVAHETNGWDKNMDFFVARAGVNSLNNFKCTLPEKQAKFLSDFLKWYSIQEGDKYCI